MENEQPDRAERRRQEKQQGKWNEEKWGKMAFREFVECPVCHCQNRYSVEALRGEIPEDKLVNKPPAIGAFEMVYDTALYRIVLSVVVDSCCECGNLITVARSKQKTPLTMLPKGGDMPGLGGPGSRLFRPR